ncbi:UNVERIFIED_CONTAM: hypothetical protein ABIC26_001258 [Paenibacillus sp. PvR008]
MKHTYKYLQNHPKRSYLPYKSESIGSTLLAKASGVFFTFRGKNNEREIFAAITIVILLAG